ncbi:hypothetical protein GINT2_000165 [Glugoides intestinalis]
MEKLVFSNNTIIDLVIPPNLSIKGVISEMLHEVRHLIIIDTCGRLNPNSTEHCWIADKKATDRFKAIEKLDYFFIYSHEDFYRKLKKIKSFKNFLLVIDTITFTCDCSPFTIKEVSNVLWSIIYDCNATIITVNHFRIEKTKNQTRLVPRMGYFWSRVVSYQVEFSNANGRLEYKVNENRIDGM